MNLLTNFVKLKTKRIMNYIGDIVGWGIIIWGVLSVITQGFFFVLPMYPSYLLTRKIGEKASRIIFKISLWCIPITLIYPFAACFLDINCGMDFLLELDISDWDLVAPFVANALFSVFHYFGMKGAIEDMKAEEEAKKTGGEPQYKTIGQITNMHK